MRWPCLTGRTGFEEDKDFPVVLNAVIAGRYHVTEYLGSAAFSKAIQAHDLHTGMDVCMKIIKNNKDFFDQSLDEIKLLKYINKNDPVDKHHLLRLYDYFYHREHLFIVCELLRANLYEFHKYNRESGGEVYFTMPRLQVFAMPVTFPFLLLKVFSSISYHVCLILTASHMRNFCYGGH
jgi:serine/threonine protein kinase